MEVIRDAVTSGRHAALEGSTGMGKTIAVLCGILASPEASARKIVYCCRTHKQMDRVVEELHALRSKLPISGMSMRGRREMCINPLVRRFTEGAADAADVCSMYKKLGKCEFYENMLERERRAAELRDEISKRPTFAADLIEICKQEGFCPYEVAREALAEVKVVAASYIYLLDPTIRLLFLKGMGADLSDLIVVLDEAHNLPDIAVELASDSLSATSIASAAREAKEFKNELAFRAARCLGELLEELASERIGEEEGEELLRGKELSDAIAEALRREGIDLGLEALVSSLQRIGEEHMLQRIRRGEVPRSYIRKLGGFLEAWMATIDES
ncbi:MAG: hypothetical protein NZ934_03710, partial [Hadesarchaea archaeon]|nr:hypothetical protein [Hadesarchaea archaeon]